MAKAERRREPTLGAHASYKGSHRAYVCEHGIVQSTCRCPGPKDEIQVTCALDCPGRTKRKGRKRG